MKVSRLSVSELRQFSTRFELLALEPGLNLIAGANETGKSALVRALQAVFFERYSTRSVDDLRPWQDSNAAPEVQVDFEHAGNHYQLSKRFLKKSQCRLLRDADSYEGDQAEALLQKLLGFSYPGKGASKEEYWGIPGLLWITQGTGQDLARPISHAHDFLRESLSQGLEEMVTQGGDGLVDEIAADRAMLLTQTGKPTGDLKKLAADVEEARLALADTEQKVLHYQQSVDRLAAVRAEWQQHEAERPWEEAERRKGEATRQLDTVNLQRQSLTRNEAELKQVHSEHQLLLEQLRQWQRDSEHLVVRAERVKELQAALVETRQHRAQLETAMAAARTRLQNAEAAQAQADVSRRRIELEARIRELGQIVEREAAQLRRAQEEQQKRARLQQDLAQDRLDAAQVDTLAEREAALRALDSRRAALATRIGYRLQAGAELRLGDSILSGEGEATLIESTPLALPGIGELTIEPGGQDLAVLATQEREARRAYETSLEAIGVTSVAQARRRLADQRETEQQLRWLDQALKDLAPVGIDALRAELEAREVRFRQLQEDLDQLPPAPADQPNSEMAQDACAVARQQQESLAAQVQVAREREVAITTELKSAQAEHQELRQRVEGAERQQKHRISQDRLLELNAGIGRLQREISRQQAAIDSASPQLLEDDIQRFGRAADVSRTAQRERLTEIARLEGALAAEGVAGLAGERAERKARTERLERHYLALELRANALDRLYQRLQQKRTALVERLQAPLQRHISAYLRILFPEAQLQISDAFQPGRLARKGAAEVDFGALSYGAREQVGVILRLAYADALKEAGRPTLIVLDDALVHSDKQRRDAMQRVLYSASRRHQILLFTCHPDNWSNLGVPIRPLEKLKAEAGL